MGAARNSRIVASEKQANRERRGIVVTLSLIHSHTQKALIANISRSIHQIHIGLFRATLDTKAPGDKAVDPATFDAADPLVDKIAEIVDSVLLSDQLANLRQALEELGKAIGPRYTANLSVIVDVFDGERENAVPLLKTGLSTNENGPPYRNWGDSTAQRYVVNGEIQVVPHDHCPKCWDVWDFKFENRTCGHCGTTLGDNCKVLLDSDVCPHCEEGIVSMTKPVCDKCGYRVDLNLVTWG